MGLDVQSVVTKKTFVLLAQFLVLGTLCAMAQTAHAWHNVQLVAIILIFALTNVFLLFQPQTAFEHHRFSTWIFAFDTFAISLIIFFLGRGALELYLAYFLTIFIAAVSGRVRVAVGTSMVSCAVYAFLTMYGRTGLELLSSAFAVRAAFFVVAALLVGYLAEGARREREERHIAQSLLGMLSGMATLFDVSSKLVSTLSLPQLYRQIVEGAVRSLAADAGSVMIKDPETNLLRIEAAVGGDAETLVGHTLQLGERIAGRVAEQGTAVLLQERMVENPEFAPYASRRGIRSALCAPLKVSGQTLGVINVNRISSKEPFQSEDLDLLVIFANHAAMVLDRMQLFGRVEALSRTDRLLDIHNRGAFDDHLKEEIGRAKRYGRPFVLMIMDVDGFKVYNDLYGHQAGDAALRRIAAAVKSTMRETDFVSRYGGDEIAVILPESDLNSAVQVAERIKRATVQTAVLQANDGRAAVLTLSIGIAEFRPASMRSGEDVVELADAALYRAKKAGGNKVFAMYGTQRGGFTSYEPRGLSYQ